MCKFFKSNKSALDNIVKSAYISGIMTLALVAEKSGAVVGDT